jgi:hypothetical protein
MPNPIGQFGIGNIAQTGAVDQIQSVSRVDLVVGHIVGELSNKVDAYFKEREAAGQKPWPEGGKADLTVVTPETYASGNTPELEDALKSMTVDERHEMQQKLMQHLASHGYSSHIHDDVNALRLNVTIWDPHWNPFPVYQIYWRNSNHMYRFQPDAEGWVHDHFISGRGDHARVWYNVVSHQYEVRDVHVWDRSQPQRNDPAAQRAVRWAQQTIFNQNLRPE